MLGVDDIRSALISYMKANSTITTALGSTVEIRERQWQGTEFVYPCIRVSIGSAVPQMAGECDVFDCNVSITVFSELAQSSQADNITGIINTVLHRRSFSYGGVRFMVWTSRLIEAVREDTRTWRSELILQTTVNG